jgi:hypothetical protein
MTKQAGNSGDSKSHARESTTAPNLPAPVPATVNNCPNGICISGGTVTNPTVVNGSPPPKLKITQGDQNQPNNAPVSFDGPPHLEALYRSTILIEVTGSEVPNLQVYAKGLKLRQLECGPKDMYKMVAAVNGEASCAMSRVFGDDWLINIQTVSPKSPGDVHIDIICPSCEH